MSAPIHCCPASRKRTPEPTFKKELRLFGENVPGYKTGHQIYLKKLVLLRKNIPAL